MNISSSNYAFLLVSLAVLLRLLVGLGPYSGKGVPPKYGDYEAQRHWMEVTIHLPPKQWYCNSSQNDLSYWGIDYPPLSAYQSWIHGKIIQSIEPEAVELITSHGYETESSKLLLRWSIVLSDLLVYFPGVLWNHQECWKSLLLDCGLILIDHGHFQYNCLSLGFVLLSVAALLQDHNFLASSFFVCAFHHKHMALYYAPAFFAYLVGHCLTQPHFHHKVRYFVMLGSTVIGTTVLVWFPLRNELVGVLQRLFPVGRGLFEDYVSNFWCITSVFIKWKAWIPSTLMIRICAILTFAFCLPSMLLQIFHPTKKAFLYGLAISSLTFYLFAFQVHEKSILMVSLAINLLTPYESQWTQYFPIFASFSMFPLLEKDKLTLQYLSINLLYLTLCQTPPVPWKKFLGVFGGGMASLHLARWMIKAPTNYPFLHDLFFSGLSFVGLFGILMYLNYRLWNNSTYTFSKKGQ